MKYQIGLGTTEEYDELVDFLNYVFSIDFKKHLPYIYNNGPEIAKEHIVLKENGKIKAALLCYRNEIIACGKPLCMAGIGTVAVHPYARGKGYMKAIMNEAEKLCKENKVDIVELSGLRQRYEYFGYTPCMMDISMYLSESAILKCKPLFDCKDIEILPLYSQPEFFAEYEKLYNTLPLRVLRKKEFYEQTEIFCIYKKSVFIGYFIMKEIAAIEFVMTDYKLAMPAIFKIIENKKLANIIIKPNFWQQELIAELTKYCDGRKVGSGLSINVLNYQSILQTAMEIKNKIRPLAKGVLCVQIEEHGCYEIAVNSEGVFVEQTKKTADKVFNHLQAMDYFFSPIQALVIDSRYKSELETNWFPLPLCINGADCV